MKKQKRKSRKSLKKRKEYTEKEMRFIIKMHSLKLIYLDNALLGFRTDEPSKRICGEDFLKWVKETNITTIISFINIYELRPLFIGKIKKSHPELANDVLKTLQDFNPEVISEKDTEKLAKENKTLWSFLTKKFKLGEEDAAHFVMAVASNCDLFVSFNKRAFQQNYKKIENKVMKLKIEMPKVSTIKDIEKNMEIYNGIISKFRQK